jgi:hypothetical protein
MHNLYAAPFDRESQRQDQLNIVAASLNAQLNTAIKQIQNLNGLGRASSDTASALEAIDISFKALRRARILVEVLGDSLSTLH